MSKPNILMIWADALGEPYYVNLASRIAGLTRDLGQDILVSETIADMMGWEVCKLAGSVAKAANLAVPDSVPLTNMSDLVDVCHRITRAANLPLVVDADDGGATPVNLFRTVRELEAAGVSAIGVSWGHHSVERLREWAPVVDSVEELGRLLGV